MSSRLHGLVALLALGLAVACAGAAQPGPAEAAASPPAATPPAAMRPKCAHLLSSSEVAHLRMNVATHGLSVDDGLVLPGCYRVRAVVTIDLVR